MGDDSIDMVISHIDMGYLVSPVLPQPPRPSIIQRGKAWRRRFRVDTETPGLYPGPNDREIRVTVFKGPPMV
jgi:hypothetical protein